MNLQGRVITVVVGLHTARHGSSAGAADLAITVALWIWDEIPKWCNSEDDENASLHLLTVFE